MRIRVNYAVKAMKNQSLFSVGTLKIAVRLILLTLPLGTRTYLIGLLRHT